MSIAEVIDATGWTWEYVERHMDLHRYAAFCRQWRRSPPLRDMVQAYLGIESVADQPLPQDQDADDEAAAIDAFVRNFAAAGGLVN